MTHFQPADEREHAKATRGEDVPDYCAHCAGAFMDHENGRCPDCACSDPTCTLPHSGDDPQHR